MGLEWFKYTGIIYLFLAYWYMYIECVYFILPFYPYIYVHHVHNHDNVVHDVYHVFITEQI